MTDPWTYDDIRSKWVHEDNLVNQRITWLLVSQGLLFAGYGGALGILGDDCISSNKIANLFIQNVPYLGAGLSILSMIGVVMGLLAQEVLRKKNEDVRAFQDGNEFIVASLIRRLAWIMSVGIPIAFIIFWCSCVKW